jgi:membrane-associated protease RseP (regulator of RpoE activity)
MAAILSFGTYLILKFRFLFLISYRSLIMLFVVLFILFYIFSCVFAHFVTAKKRALKQHKTRNAVLFILFNPFFVMAYLWLFGTIVYSGFYLPCAVTIVGIEKSNLTADTMSLGIQPGEKIVSIDGTQIKTLQDVKNYLNNLTSTKEVLLETEKNVYYVHTYKNGDSRYMGLILGQDYCVRNY